MDTIPEHVDKAIHWVCFGLYMIILLLRRCLFGVLYAY